ncbi:helix-turn-helix domain-containing protein [Hyphobacterium sp.]|uniref:helix-turn-helix domain-containing protein n=1 Tax=Hyphobacterium sp. TaxID=2004662 RepID=UPI003B52CB68
MGMTPGLLPLLQSISANRDDKRSLADFSASAGMPKYTLHRRFKRLLGETPKQYDLRLRLEHAAMLLATTARPVLAIALEVGFESHEGFTRAFRRMFDCPPAHFRARLKTQVNEDSRRRGAGLEHSVGPCLRLYGIRPRSGQERSEMPTSEITLRKVERQPILFVRRRVSRTQLQPLFAECFPKIFQHCIASGIAIAGQPMARYVETGHGLWTIDSAIPVAVDAPSAGEIEAGEIQPGPVALAVHHGAYETLGETHAAIELWIEDSDHRAEGAPWESYVTSPAEYPDIADWRTEVFWPLVDETGRGVAP